jgi:hypothetical protein
MITPPPPGDIVALVGLYMRTRLRAYRATAAGQQDIAAAAHLLATQLWAQLEQEPQERRKP